MICAFSAFSAKRISFLAALVGALLWCGQTKVHAQKGSAPEAVNITTVDGVKLKASFYASPMKSIATVIMLHPIGDGKSKSAPEWRLLAEKLQEANYSVITFDFRGHGDSTAVDDKVFWNFPPNKLVKMDPKDRQAIDVKNYIKNGKSYLPILINDIAAVRAYLERRNDQDKDCNAGSIVVIGADAGATLGAIWINSEWYRHKFTPDPKFLPAIEIQKPANYIEPAGNDIKGAIFLTISPTLEGRPVNLAKVLHLPCKENVMAAAFFYGSKDAQAANLAKNVIPKIKVKDSNKHAFIGPVEFEGTGLGGIKLLQKNNIKTVLASLEAYVPDRRVERTNRDFGTTDYRWGIGASSTPARGFKGGNNFLFNDYSKFIPN